MAALHIPGSSLADLARTVWRYRTILRATTQVEIKKKFAGSLLGMVWLVLHPLLFLLLYLFLFTVIFGMRFPGMSDLGYVVYVFSALVPFLALTEALSAGVATIRQSMHLIKNVIVPIDLVPVRTALMVLAPLFVGLAVVIVLSLIDGSLGPRVLLLPVVVAVHLAFMVGLVLLVSSLGVLLIDLGYAITLIMTFLMFVTPIGFLPEILPVWAKPLIWGNPVYYMIESYRTALISTYTPRWFEFLVFTVIATLALIGGASVFRRLKRVIVDYD